MKKFTLIFLLSFFSLNLNAQIDTVLLNEQAALMFPSFPVKSSYTSLIDRRPGLQIIYSANMEHGLEFFNFATSGNISSTGVWPISSLNNLDVSTIEQRGNSLFIGTGDFQVNTNSASGLTILDITNLVTPFIKDSWDSTAFSHGISHILVDGDYAYLSTMKDGIIILDISDEENIIFKSHLQLDLNFPTASLNAHNARGLKIVNNLLYVCFDRGGIRLVDVTDKSNPIEIYKYINVNLNGQAAAAYNDIVIKNNFAFVSVDYCGIEVIDISQTPFTSIQWYNPWNCNTSNWSGAPLHTNEMILASNDSLLFVSGGQSEVFVFDVTDALNVHKVGEYAFVNDSLATHGLDVYNNKVILSFIHTPVFLPPFTPFYADPGGLKLLDYTTLNSIASIEPKVSQKGFLEVYPNPNFDDLIQLNSYNQNTEVEIYDHLGKLMFKGNTNDSNKIMISTKNWHAGIYALLGTYHHTTHVTQFVKID
ncbi:MAG TPA: T9SS type A sorting domain-containing protein [Bacteroidia bacterium]|nr:T9SS type A sorting domain-containing protein [Bacteroidia bacterium]